MSRHLLLSLLFACLLACTPAEQQTGESLSMSDPSAAGLPKGVWRVEDIDQRGFIDYSMITISFTEEGRISGSGGCNPYFAGVDLDRGNLVISPVGSGRRACAPALMNQEARFFDALTASASLEVVNNTILYLSDALGMRRIRAVRQSPEPQDKAPQDKAPQEKAPQDKAPRDMALMSSTTFECGSAGIAAMRFLGPDTIELAISEQVRILTQAQAASGVRYTANDISFWNKGDEARLETSGTVFQCRRENQ